MTLSEADELEPARFLNDTFPSGRDLPPSDLLILNQPITHFAAFSRLWKHTTYRICADGGANRLFDMFEGKLSTEREHFLPDIVHGDLDSLRNDVRDYYQSHGVEISHDKDQYSTDFGKCMQKISARTDAGPTQDVVILGSLGGRVDQGLGLLHEMIREESKRPRLRLWLFSECSLSIVLKSKHNIIRGLQSSRLFTENLGLVPIYCPATISTAGLEWDVQDWDTHMGGQVSTSNHVRADEVHVHTNAPILFTIERAPLEKAEKR